MDSVCRTCMRIIDNQEEIISINDTELRDKLRVCLPELILDNVVDPKMCSSCSAALSLSFRFKEMCHQAEQTINNSLQNKSSDGEIKPLNEFELLTLGRREIQETDDDTEIKSFSFTDTKVQILSEVDCPTTPQESFTNNRDDEIKSVQIERTSGHAEKIIVMPEDSIEEHIDTFISTDCTVHEPLCKNIDETTGDISTDYTSLAQSIKLEDPWLSQINPLQAEDCEEKQMLVDFTAQSTFSFDHYKETVSPKKTPVNHKSPVRDKTDKVQLNRTNKSCRRKILTVTKLSEPLKMAEHQTRSAVKLLGVHQNTNGNSEIITKGLLKTDAIKTELGVETPKNSVACKKDLNQTECTPKATIKKEPESPIIGREGKTLKISWEKRVKSSTNVMSNTQRTTRQVKQYGKGEVPKLSKTAIIDKKSVRKSHKVKLVKVELVNKSQSTSATTEPEVQNTNITKNHSKSVTAVFKTKVQNKTNKGDYTVNRKSVRKRKREQSPKISDPLRKRSCSEPKTNEGQIANSDNIQDDVANALQQLLQTPEYKNILQIQTSSEHHLVKSGIVAKTLQQLEQTIQQQICTKVETPTPNRRKLVAKKSTKGMLKSARHIQELKEIDLDLGEINDGVQQQKPALAANCNQVLNDKGVSPLQSPALHTEREPVAEEIETIDVSEVIDGRKCRKINFQRCETCGRVLRSISHLNIHLRSHILEKSFVCELCGKSFSLQRNLLSHTMLHFTAGNHQCTICEKYFSSAYVLKNHMLIHTGEKPYVCLVCDNRFTQKVNLKVHMVVHTRARNFICYLCNSSFAQKTHLVTHMRMHTGEKPYTCDICPKAFSKSYVLRCHKQAHQHKPFQCDICLYCFRSKKIIEYHLRRCKNKASYLKPSPEDNHRCGTCSRLFSSKFCRDRHLKVHAKF